MSDVHDSIFGTSSSDNRDGQHPGEFSFGSIPSVSSGSGSSSKEDPATFSELASTEDRRQRKKSRTKRRRNGGVCLPFERWSEMSFLTLVSFLLFVAICCCLAVICTVPPEQARSYLVDWFPNFDRRSPKLILNVSDSNQNLMKLKQGNGPRSQNVSKKTFSHTPHRPKELLTAASVGEKSQQSVGFCIGNQSRCSFSYFVFFLLVSLCALSFGLCLKTHFYPNPRPQDIPAIEKSCFERFRARWPCDARSIVALVVFFIWVTVFVSWFVTCVRPNSLAEKHTKIMEELLRIDESTSCFRMPISSGDFDSLGFVRSESETKCAW